MLEELGRRGFATVSEPGRRIVETELQEDGAALPWVDLGAFARRALAVARHDREGAPVTDRWVFFDRGLVDAAVALEHATGSPTSDTLRAFPGYHRQVFMTPPWPEIFSVDGERQHDLTEAVAEYERLLAAYHALGYEIVLLPKVDVGARADFVLGLLG